MNNINQEIEVIRRLAGLNNINEDTTYSMYAHEDVVRLIDEEKKFLMQISKFAKNSQMTDAQFERFMMFVKDRVDELINVTQGYRPSATPDVHDEVEDIRRHKGNTSMYRDNEKYSANPNRKPNISIKV